jgi:hypothetical protein
MEDFFDTLFRPHAQYSDLRTICSIIIAIGTCGFGVIFMVFASAAVDLITRRRRNITYLFGVCWICLGLARLLDVYFIGTRGLFPPDLITLLTAMFTAVTMFYVPVVILAINKAKGLAETNKNIDELKEKMDTLIEIKSETKKED